MKRLLQLSHVVAMMAFFVGSGLVFAQQDFYYSRGQKIPLGVSSEKISIKFTSGPIETQIQSLLSAEPVLGARKSLGPASAQGFFTVSLQFATNVKGLVGRLRAMPQVNTVNPVYLLDGLEAIPFDHFMIQFKSSVTRAEIDALNTQHNVEVVTVSTASPNLYTLRITSNSDYSVLEMAKIYYESLPAEWSMPDFIVPIELFQPPNDTYFDKQYYLHNTGQTGGVPDADIDALEAWGLSTGSSNITVAVIDEGTEAHEDLPSARLVAGYDYYALDNDPSPGGNQAHGMTTAGIVAATQNNNGETHPQMLEQTCL